MLVHYIIVRRDLPLGTLAAMVTHAAGESAAIYADAHIEGFTGAIAVVLEAKDEAALDEDHAYLNAQRLNHVNVHESNGTFAGQYMAIGVVPCEREDVAEKFRHFQCLKSVE